MRLSQTVELALDKCRAISVIFLQLMFPPTDRQIASKRLAIIEIGSDDRCYEIETERDSGDALARVASERYSRQHKGLDVLGNAGRSDDTHFLAFNITTNFLRTGKLVRNDRNAGSGIDDEVERIIDPLELDL